MKRDETHGTKIEYESKDTDEVPMKSHECAVIRFHIHLGHRVLP